MRRFVSTAISEFSARGLLWLRVLLLGALLPLEQYGLVLVYLGVEGLLAATASYPFIKDVMVRQDLRPILYLRYATFFALIAVPAMLLMMIPGKLEWGVALALAIAGFLNGLTQTGLYALRVADVMSYNRVKLVWSVVTTALFLGLLPLHWLWLPVIYLAGAAIVLAGTARTIRRTQVEPAYIADRAHHLRGWLIFGTQALMLSLPQNGIRIIIAALMTLEDVARFTLVYMIATALFFVYSAVMITCEAELSRAAPPSELRARIKSAASYCVAFVAIALAYFIALTAMNGIGLIKVLFDIQLDSEPLLLPVLIIFVATNGVQTILNALVLAASGRSMTLLATSAGAAILMFLTIVLIPAEGLLGVGVALAIGQVATVLVLILYLIRKFRLTRDS